MIQSKNTSKAFSCFLFAFLNNKSDGDFGLSFAHTLHFGSQLLQLKLSHFTRNLATSCLLGVFYGQKRGNEL